MEGKAGTRVGRLEQEGRDGRYTAELKRRGGK